ncbi:hypothetical protein N474_11345 [Pseudoalteromonas luteoviolacea CPMOR-2]|uniref:SRCR domain-containing protein n=1 Tax=Pseudoalteromonas luteoviolacea DSM 6061 TaxID=1365250 RepID=A0A166V8F8_9GAMM|nr:hypothetical protein N475_22030 [Pseudoalteromonas luteoviolacea DSM 6061]KZN56740.1 hypothetical protein N474_11345 [Pseudoalteromonas luteoviolacea CPMOR-2]
MKRAILTLALLATGNVVAQPIYCSGKISSVYIQSDGNVNINGTWRNSWTSICNTKGSDPITCSLWASYAASAVQNNLKVTVSYNLPAGSSCASLETYGNAPKPTYFMIHNPSM